MIETNQKQIYTKSVNNHWFMREINQPILFLLIVNVM